jgi:hypothetical protein
MNFRLKLVQDLTAKMSLSTFLQQIFSGRDTAGMTLVKDSELVYSSREPSAIWPNSRHLEQVIFSFNWCPRPNELCWNPCEIESTTQWCRLTNR